MMSRGLNVCMYDFFLILIIFFPSEQCAKVHFKVNFSVATTSLPNDRRSVCIHFFQKPYKYLNVAGFEPTPLGTRSSALTVKPYVIIELRQNSHKHVTIYLWCQFVSQFPKKVFFFPKVWNNTLKVLKVLLI